MLLLLLTALLLRDSESRGDLTAQIDMVGTSGSISINTNTWILQTNLSGTCGSVTISVHEFPVVYGAWRDPCDERFIGRPRYNVTMTSLGRAVIDSTIRYEGRSVALQTCGRRTCANLQDASQRTWQAKLRSSIIGQAYFVQSLPQSRIWGVLDLAMLEGTPTSDASLLISSTCRIEDGHVLGSVQLGSDYRFVKSRLDVSNISVMPFLLVKYNETLVCSEVKAVTPKEAMAPISMLGINGSFTFRQKSPFHPTHITIDLWRLRGRADHYGVHSFPVLPRQDVCSTAGKLWDPWGVSGQSTPAPSGHSSWPLGDLSGRHGSLQGQESCVVELTDWTLPIFGNNSIVGRSVVISNIGGAAWACGTIGLAGGATRAIAVFRKGVIGRVMFQQARHDPYGDLSIYVELSHASEDVSRRHNWRIHSDALRTESESCANAGGHFNPYGVAVSGGCTWTHPLWCKVGDLAFKHQPISFLTPDPARYVFTDTSISLSGPNSIIGRSVVVHGADGNSTRVACANILLQRSQEGRSGAWSGAGHARGDLRASQASDLAPTVVDFTFHGLRGLAGGFHIHLLPVCGPSDDPCSNALIRGHFNPFSVQASMSPAAGDGTDDEYEVGDISGRRGSLHGQDNVTKQYTDMNFPLLGTHGVLGRSLVIHYANGSRMQCASFLPDLPPDGEWVRATAEFSGNISGRISLSQMVYADGGSGETTILVDLHSSSSSGGLAWSIGSAEREAYNPYDVPGQNVGRCSARTPQLCRVGDLTGKHGAVAPGDKVLLTDPNLPLAGDVAVTGRTLTLTWDAQHDSALILPDAPVTSLYLQRMTSFNRSAVRERVSLIQNVAPWRVIMLPDGPNSDTACHHVAFYIIGVPHSAALSSTPTWESLGPPCLPPPGSLESSAGRDRRTMAALLVMVTLLLPLW